MERLRQNKGFLCHACEARGKSLKHLLRYATHDQLKTLSEIALNILEGNVPLSERQKKKLAPYKNVVRLLARKNVPLREKQVAMQKGAGILPLLASAVIPALIELFRSR